MYRIEGLKIKGRKH